MGRWRKATIRPDRLLIADDGVEMDVALRDADGRRIEIQINDREGTLRRRSTLLAPVGSGVEHPYSFFLVLMRGFDLLRTSGTQPRLVFGGQERHIASFPGPEWLHRRRFARYSSEPIIVELNPNHDGPLTDVGPVQGISQLSTGDGMRAATLRFEPIFPNLQLLEPGLTASGGWTLDVADQPALTGGSWRVERTAEMATITLEVTRPWRPRDLPLSLKLVTSVAQVFRTWPMTYRWSAEVDLHVDPPTMHGRWTRTEPVNRANVYRIPRPSRRAAFAALAALPALALGVAAWARRRRQ